MKLNFGPWCQRQMSCTNVNKLMKLNKYWVKLPPCRFFHFENFNRKTRQTIILIWCFVSLSITRVLPAVTLIFWKSFMLQSIMLAPSLCCLICFFFFCVFFVVFFYSGADVCSVTTRNVSPLMYNMMSNSRDILKRPWFCVSLRMCTGPVFRWRQ